MLYYPDDRFCDALVTSVCVNAQKLVMTSFITDYTKYKSTKVQMEVLFAVFRMRDRACVSQKWMTSLISCSVSHVLPLH